ncbi:hypothetical protein SEA_CLARK_77 [Gordonia phage Clark]|uniref:Uncharacterized protein n=4 Tax=Beenievirus TaxID=3044673 RepID=A0A4Y6EH14_9CAUD|nr:hypothetical protein PP502_gp72 [Gordonia phage Beenie]YP_010654472.1 hypothetical protein PP507_gp77 [Gordonia phage Clark]YP_010654631.1 hypothetical protein PP509_gp79 [Gordonia phage MichaelScott]YP_010654708.1 hypothetical protein PP510_gp76 [Gordonia phage Easley]AUV61637.1 hypothetical protein PBI_BEENIE_72 [Gordonia phage Beenie]AWN05100.1 hypothetical protein SEA_EASLEY_76 [Gordonia phage Easley]QDF18026.1 hypothetical protein SEA_CLARK_77 [Gordonia phage Clark]QOC56321.1 hypothe
MPHRVQITREHPHFDATLAIIRQYPDLMNPTHPMPGATRVPKDRCWMVYPDAGRPYIEVEVFELGEHGEFLVRDGGIAIEADRRRIYID